MLFKIAKNRFKIIKYNIFKFLIEKVDILFETYIFPRYFDK